MLNDSFHRSSIRSLPTGWEMCTIASLGEVVTGTTPSTSHPEFYGGDIPFVSPVDLGDERYITGTQKTLTNQGAQQARLLPPGSILVTCIGILGKVGQAETTLATNQQINSLIPSAEIDASYAYWSMHLLKPQLVVEAGLQVVPIVNKSRFSRLTLPIPPLLEQRHIAEILDSADEAVRQTERVIAKLKTVKAGLLHDLLTRGLDEHGHLRDTEAHPEQFKDSPLGRIPGKWEATTIDELAVHVGSGATPRGGSKVYQSEGVVFIRSQNVTFDGLLLEDVAYIDEQIHRDMARSEVFAHDVLLNITGASIGRCCPVPEGLGLANVNQHVCAIRLPDPNHNNAVYLSAVLASDSGQHQIDQFNAGSNREGLNYGQLRSFVIPWPPESERVRIAAVLDAHDARIRAEEAELAKLRQVKRGLMDDLLTGKVRVKL
jgi:type I restriction enzyme S subunit